MSNWTDGLLFGTSAASAGDDELRSFMTQLASGISASFHWPGSGGGSLASAGESKLGNARTAHSGNVAGGFPNGFLSTNTAHVSLHHIGVSPFLVGHSSMEDYGPASVLPNGSVRWVTQSGTFSLSSTVDSVVSSKIVSFTSSYNSGGAALIFLTTQQPNIASGYIVRVTGATGVGAVSTTTNFTSAYSAYGTPVSVTTVWWESIGTMTL